MYHNRFGEEQSVGFNRFYDILERYGLKVRKRKRRVSTTDSIMIFLFIQTWLKTWSPLVPVSW